MHLLPRLIWVHHSHTGRYWKGVVFGHWRARRQSQQHLRGVRLCQTQAAALSLITPAEASLLLPKTGWQRNPASGFLAERTLPLALGQNSPSLPENCKQSLFLKLRRKKMFFFSSTGWLFQSHHKVQSWIKYSTTYSGITRGGAGCTRCHF